MHTPAPCGRLLVPLAAALLAGGLVVLPATGAAADHLDHDTYYQLISVHSGKAIEIEAGAASPGAMAVQWEPHSGQNQQFRFAPTGDGYHRLIARHSAMVLDVYQWNPANGAEIRQWTDLGGTNQQWQVLHAGGDEVSLVNRFSGKALDLWEWSTADGARISQYDPTGGANQRWRLVAVDGPPDGGSGACGSGPADAEVVANGNGWLASNDGSTVYNGPSMLDAMRAAVASLTVGRTWQERVVVRDSGTIPANRSVDLPDHTSLESCGTIHVSGTPTGDNAVVRGRNVTNVSVPHLQVTGAPWFGVFIRNGSNIHLGQIELRLTGGLGVRIDNHANRAVRVRDVRIDHVYVEGTNNHGVETYGVDGLTIGTVIARNTGFAGLLLNDTIHATVELVDGVGAGTGTGYAAFRMANRNGRVGNDYPTNIRVGQVIARGGGRGIFCVSESGGVTIERVDIAQTGSNAILIENCYNVRIATLGGTVRDRDIRIAARSEFPASRDVTIENLTVTNSAITENPCAVNLVLRNNTLVNSPVNRC
jgi:hypothetical protein